MGHVENEMKSLFDRFVHNDSKIKSKVAYLHEHLVIEERGSIKQMLSWTNRKGIGDVWPLERLLTLLHALVGGLPRQLFHEQHTLQI